VSGGCEAGYGTRRACRYIFLPIARGSSNHECYPRVGCVADCGFLRVGDERGGGSCVGAGVGWDLSVDRVLLFPEYRGAAGAGGGVVSGVCAVSWIARGREAGVGDECDASGVYGAEFVGDRDFERGEREAAELLRVLNAHA